MSVAELLKNLIELQGMDKQIFDMKKKLGDMPLVRKGLDERLDNVAADLKQAEDSLKKIQVERKNKELDLETKENSIKKYQTQLYQVKTNNEYAALQREIDGLKADKSLLEEEIIAILDKIDEAEKTLSGQKGLLQQEKALIDGERKKLDAEEAQMQQRISGLEAKRNEITPLIDKKSLARYERILTGRDGLAIVPIKGENCGGCFVNLPPQVMNEVGAKEKIIYCERCSRMLFLEEQEMA